jgi:stage III sporulation protein AE
MDRRNGRLKKKIIPLFLFSLVCFFFLSTTSFAQSYEEEIREFSQADGIWEAIPEEMDKETLKKWMEESRGTGLFRVILDTLSAALSIGLRDGFSFFLGLCAILLFSTLSEAIKRSFSSGMHGAFDFLFLLILSGCSYLALKEAFDVVAQSLHLLHSFFLSGLPITTILLAMSGSVQTAALQKGQVSLVISFISALISQFLFPLLRALFCFSLVDSFSVVRLQGLTNGLKKTVKTLCVLLFTLLSAVLAIGNVLAAAGDSMAMRSVRFAAGNFIPVVGSLVGEASKTVAASLKLVKSECGILCLLVILFVLMRPITFLTVKKIALSLSVQIGELLGESKCVGFLRNLSGILDLCMALVISEGIYFIFYITLFIQNRGTAL